MEKKKTGWAGIEGKKTKARLPKHRSAKPAKRMREIKPPFGILVGRRTDNGAYELTPQSFDKASEMMTFVKDVLTKEDHQGGLREVMIHLRPVAEAK